MLTLQPLVGENIYTFIGFEEKVLTPSLIEELVNYLKDIRVQTLQGLSRRLKEQDDPKELFDGFVTRYVAGQTRGFSIYDEQNGSEYYFLLSSLHPTKTLLIKGGIPPKSPNNYTKITLRKKPASREEVKELISLLPGLPKEITDKIFYWFTVARGEYAPGTTKTLKRPIKHRKITNT
jgi:hypothetical protein